MQPASVTVVIPTLVADSALRECLESLNGQTRQDFEIVIVDNSGQGLVRERVPLQANTRLIENRQNVGFGRAFNQAFRVSNAAFIATLNDDATASPHWVAELLNTMESEPRVGMCASQVLLGSGDSVDSAGMLIAADGSSKQRGHRSKPDAYRNIDEVLLPSGSAALYRRAMLDRIGLFDDDFFLYCEDTDLGLRARRAGWNCLYVPSAVVHHKYSHSAGRASSLKAYYVERNRLFLIAKNYPAGMLATALFASLVRYFWHVTALFTGRGAAAEFHRHGSGFELAWIVIKAHFAAFLHLPELLRKRRGIQKNATLSTREFGALLGRHRISLRQVASL
ncbi:MAG TPA: glycosyltransferase family 2 protein [Bryobacteraceae bacterium]|nr:glycosyltransferase family 2 protein [Bryobacteraceae bacterium]